MESGANLLLAPQEFSASREQSVSGNSLKYFDDNGKGALLDGESREDFSTVLGRSMERDGEQELPGREGKPLPQGGNDAVQQSKESLPEQSALPADDLRVEALEVKNGQELAQPLNQQPVAQPLQELITENGIEFVEATAEAAPIVSVHPLQTAQLQTLEVEEAPLENMVAPTVDAAVTGQVAVNDSIADVEEPSTELAEGEEVVAQLQMAGVMATPLPAEQSMVSSQNRVLTPEAAVQAALQGGASAQAPVAGAVVQSHQTRQNASTQPLPTAAQGEIDASMDGVTEEGELLNLAVKKQSAGVPGKESMLPPELQRPAQPVLMKQMDLAQAVGAGLRGGQQGFELAGATQGRERPGQMPLTAVDPLSSPLLQGGGDSSMNASRATALKGMTVPPQSNQWASALGERMVVMASKKIQSAEIRLNPPNMGILEVKLALNGDQAQLVFQSGNANVRDALDLSVQRLREMLEQSGVQLTDVTVSDRGQQQAGMEESEGDASHPSVGNGEGGADSGDGDEVVAASTMAVGRMGLVNYYA